MDTKVVRCRFGSTNCDSVGWTRPKSDRPIRDRAIRIPFVDQGYANAHRGGIGMNRAWLQMSGVVVATATLTIGCGLGPLGLKQPQTSGSARTSGPVSLQFLQNKPEVVREWNQLINRFHAQNPNITIKQINPPNTDTALQADVAKGQVPDIIAMGADATFITMASPSQSSRRYTLLQRF